MKLHHPDSDLTVEVEDDEQAQMYLTQGWAEDKAKAKKAAPSQ